MIEHRRQLTSPVGIGLNPITPIKKGDNMKQLDKDEDKELILSLLGFFEDREREGVYEHHDFTQQFDLSKIPLESVVSHIATKFRNIGYIHCQENIRRALGLE